MMNDSFSGSMPTDVLPPPLGQDGEPTGEEEVAEAAGCWFVEASDGAAASQRLTGAWEGCKPGWAAAERHAGQSLLRLDLAAAAEGAARGAAEGAAAEGAAAAAEEEGMYWLDVCPPAGGAISPPHLPHTSPTPPPDHRGASPGATAAGCRLRWCWPSGNPGA